MQVLWEALYSKGQLLKARADLSQRKAEPAATTTASCCRSCSRTSVTGSNGHTVKKVIC